MTSKNLCCKLMAEDLKRRVWTIAATILGFLFTMVVPIAMKCSEYMERTDWSAQVRLRQGNNILELLRANPLLIIALVILAVLWGVSSFSYLHNSRKVDLYHSIPVKRHQLFLARYLNGILILAVLYAVTVAASQAFAVRAGLNPGFMPWQSYFMHLAYYCLLYTVVVVAMMMTGNLVVALLGFGVFCGYGPAASGMFYAYQTMWFHTYFETAESGALLEKLVCYSSPIANYLLSLGKLSRGKWHLQSNLPVMAVVIVLAVFAYVLYRLRPSEAAGKAMAFPKTQMPIKVLITILVAVASSMFFYSMRPNLAWVLFGAICGAVLCHCLMEIIYHFDFRKLFAQKICLGSCVAVSVLLAMAGYYDWYGYDTWVPNGTKLESAAVRLGYMDDWVTYGEPEEYERDWEVTGYGSEMAEKGSYYEWDYVSQSDYIREHMSIHDTYLLMELARGGAKAAKETRFTRNDPYAGEDGTVQYSWQNAYVQYRLSNGKVIRRRYNIPMDEHMTEIWDAIHDNTEYKTGTFPILVQTAAETAEVYYQQYDQVRRVPAEKEEIKQLLAAYQQDLKELTMETRRKELPVATIQFRTVDHKHAADVNAKSEERYYRRNMEDRCYYPIYPSFARTLAILEEYEIRPELLDETTVSELVVNYYDTELFEETLIEQAADGTVKTQVSYGDAQRINYTDPEDLQALLPAVCYGDYIRLNLYYDMMEAAGVDAFVILRSDELAETGAEDRASSVQNRETMDVKIDRNRLTEEQHKRYGLVH